MPTYDYLCDACGHEVDIDHPMRETRRKCPTCGKLKLRRAWTQVAAYHNHYSPMHPKVDRGRGNSGKRKNR